jgi:hypothetical protein
VKAFVRYKKSHNQKYNHYLEGSKETKTSTCVSARQIDANFALAGSLRMQETAFDVRVHPTDIW